MRGDVISPLTEGMAAALMEFGSAALHEAQGQTGALDPALKPIEPQMRLAGTALTVDAAPGDNLIIHYALTRAGPGHVLVVDAKGHTGVGVWGDILSLAAQKRGVTGLVIDGAVRDARSIAAMNFPVFSRGVCIQAPKKNQPGKINTSIVCGGVRIEPSDIIVGDGDGVVAIANRNLDEILRSGRERVEAEDRLRDEISAGRLTVDLLDLRPVIERLGLDLQDHLRE